MRKKIVKFASVALASIGFAYAFSGCKDEKSDVTVYVPDGAPAMAIANMLLSDTQDDGIEYNVVAPTVIASKVTNKDAQKNADICALPVTAASKLVGQGDEYQMLGVLTSGNLYVISKDSAVLSAFEESETAGLSYLVGKTVGVMKINDMPGLTFKWTLTGSGYAWQELKNDGAVAEDKINLKAIVDATAIDPADNTTACYLVAEPAASVQVKNKGFSFVCSLEMLYNAAQGEDALYKAYPQAVLVAKRSLIEKDGAFIRSFTEKVKASAQALQSGELSGEKIVQAVTSHLEDSGYTSTLKAPILTQETILRCGVQFTASMDCKDGVKDYLARISQTDSSAAKTVEDKFFYIG